MTATSFTLRQALDLVRSAENEGMLDRDISAMARVLPRSIDRLREMAKRTGHSSKTIELDSPNARLGVNIEDTGHVALSYLGTLEGSWGRPFYMTKLGETD